MLAEEYVRLQHTLCHRITNIALQGKASNIKSRVNRQSVLSAITSTQQRLKLYNKVPTNGLVVYCGEILTSEGKERKVNIDFEPLNLSIPRYTYATTNFIRRRWPNYWSLTRNLVSSSWMEMVHFLAL